MADKKQYWRDNIRLLKILLGLWVFVSFFLSIIFADALNGIRIGGFRLGFWFAQQGSIWFYVVLIFVYIWLMDKLDSRYQVDEASLHRRHEEN
jgi:putative solute:sodium symporter small subunit